MSMTINDAAIYLNESEDNIRLMLRTCPKITSGFRLRFAVEVETGR